MAGDADGQRIAIAVSTWTRSYNLEGDSFDDASRARLETARIDDGRTVTLDQCDGMTSDPFEENPITFANVDVDGDTVAWTVAGCDRRMLAVRRFGPSPGVLRLRAPAGEWQDVDIAGRYVAAGYGEVGGARAGTEVYDHLTGRRVFAVSGFAYFDLQEDGKIVAARTVGNRGCYHQVEWYSPAEPRAHRLTPVACSDGVGLADDRILWSRAPGEVAVTDLSGTSVQPIGTAGRLALVVTRFDGDELTYNQQRCGGPRIVVDRLADLAAGPPAPERCRLSLRRLRQNVRLTRKARLRVPIVCSTGCNGVDVEVRQGGRRIDVGAEAAYTRRSRTLSVGLENTFRRRLKRKRRVRVTVEVTHQQPAGTTSRTRKRITLRP